MPTVLSAEERRASAKDVAGVGDADADRAGVRPRWEDERAGHGGGRGVVADGRQEVFGFDRMAPAPVRSPARARSVPPTKRSSTSHAPASVLFGI